MEQKFKLTRAYLAGFIATLVMTLLMYLTPLFGLPRMDIPRMLGSFGQATPVPVGSGAWWIGMGIHFFLGIIIFPLVFKTTLLSLNPERQKSLGLGFGLILWFLAGLVVMPMMGSGLFGSATGAFWAINGTSILAHLIYGLTLGGTMNVKRVEKAKREEQPPPLKKVS